MLLGVGSLVFSFVTGSAGGILVSGLGAALLVVGTRQRRRGTAWAGAGITHLGLGALFGDAYSIGFTGRGATYLALGLAVTALGVVLARRGGATGWGNDGLADARVAAALGAAAAGTDPPATDPLARRVGRSVMHRLEPRLPDLLGTIGAVVASAGVVVLGADAITSEGPVVLIGVGIVFATSGYVALAVAGRGAIATAGSTLVVIGVLYAATGIGLDAASDSIGAALTFGGAALLLGAIYAAGPGRGRPVLLSVGLVALVASSTLLFTDVSGLAVGSFLVPDPVPVDGFEIEPFEVETFDPADLPTIPDFPTIPELPEFPEPMPGFSEFPAPTFPEPDFPEFSEFPFPSELAPRSAPGAWGGGGPSAAQVTRSERSGSATGAGTAQLLLAAAFGLAGLGADRRGWSGLATPFIGVGIATSIVGALVLGAATNLGVGGLAGLALAALYLAIGDRAERRGAIWLGAAGAATATFALLAQLLESPGGFGAAVTLVGVLAVTVTAASEPATAR